MSGAEPGSHGLVRRLGPFDATMLVMGGIIGAGIFVNPAEVARHVDTPLLIVGVWVLGGLIAMAGALVYAELADRRPVALGDRADARHIGRQPRGRWFEMPNHFRVGLGGDSDMLKEGLARLSSALDELH